MQRAQQVELSLCALSVRSLSALSYSVRCLTVLCALLLYNLLQYLLTVLSPCAESDHDKWPMTPLQEWCNALSMLGPAGVCIVWLIAHQTAPGSYEMILAMVWSLIALSHRALLLCSLTVLSRCSLFHCALLLCSLPAPSLTVPSYCALSLCFLSGHTYSFPFQRTVSLHFSLANCTKK